MFDMGIVNRKQVVLMVVFTIFSGVISMLAAMLAFRPILKILQNLMGSISQKPPSINDTSMWWHIALILLLAVGAVVLSCKAIRMALSIYKNTTYARYALIPLIIVNAVIIFDSVMSAIMGTLNGLLPNL